MQARALLAISLALSGPCTLHAAVRESSCPQAQIEHNKSLIRTMASVDQSTVTGLDTVAKLMARDYIQHNPEILAYQGRQGYVEAVKRLIRAHENPNYPKPVLLFADCAYVAAMVKEVRPDPDRPGQVYASFWFDIWRVANGKLVEHWDQTQKGLDYRWDEVIASLSSALKEARGPDFVTPARQPAAPAKP